MKIVGVQQPAQQERERDHACLQHIGALIDHRQAGRPRDRHAQLAPQSILRKLQLFDGAAEDMLEDHHARVRRDDNPFGAERPVGGIGGLLVKSGGSRHQLSNQAQRRVAVEHHVMLRRGGEHFGEADAGNGVRDEREGTRRIAQALDGPDLREIRMAEGRDAADTLAQREFERGHSGQLSAQAEHVECFAAARSRDAPALAEAIAEHHGRRRRCANSGWVH
jgi:hypothetical protein